MIEENLTGIFELLLISSFCLFLFSYIVIIRLYFDFKEVILIYFFSQIRKLPSKFKSSRGISLICQINIQRLITQKEV